MHSTLALMILIVVLALVFDFTNGFHDTATVVATSITTRALSPKVAIGLCAVFNFIGAFTSTAVAKTVGDGIVDSKHMPLWVIATVLVAAIAWDLLTWYAAIPSSSTCALIGALVGGGIAIAGSFSAIGWNTLLSKFVLWIFLSPVIGFIVGYVLIVILKKLVARAKPSKMNKLFKRFQIVSGILIALDHGANDSQKSMGIITMSLVSGGFLTAFNVPLWVVALCATAMGLGTSIGGKKIIKTMGNKVTKIDPMGGFVAQLSSSIVLFVATKLHAPVSTTQVMTSSLMGIGSEKSLKRVNWGMAKQIMMAWVITIPAAGILAYVLVEIIKIFVY
ncbi:MAG: inorganic phosphate transporter [Sarcina sp.]